MMAYKTILDLPITFQEPLSERVGGIDEINKLSKQQMVKEVVAWHLGSTDWYDLFESWLNSVGLEINTPASSTS